MYYICAGNHSPALLRGDEVRRSNGNCPVDAACIPGSLSPSPSTSLSPSTPPSRLLSQSIQRDLTYHGISRRHGRRDGRPSSSEPRSRSDSTATNDQAGTLSSTLFSSLPLTSTRNPDPYRWKTQCNRAPPKLSWQVEWALPLAAPSASS